MCDEMNQPFPHLVATDTPDSIYYADLFKIREKGWMIMGYGKSHAARLATNNDAAVDIARDAVAIVRRDNVLYGRYDSGAHNTRNPNLHKLYQLDAIAYCLTEAQTIKAFDETGHERKIDEAGPEVLTSLCATYPYPASFAPHFFNPLQVAYFSNERRMMAKFLELAQGVSTTKYLLVPYMPDVEAKAKLYAQCDLDNFK